MTPVLCEVSRRSGTGFPTFGVFRTDNGVPVHAHITHPTQQDMISLAHNYPSSLQHSPDQIDTYPCLLFKDD